MLLCITVYIIAVLLAIIVSVIYDKWCDKHEYDSGFKSFRKNNHNV